MNLYIRYFETSPETVFFLLHTREPMNAMFTVFAAVCFI